MKLFLYIVAHDTGFAPNPFHGHCTLANCKPVIRRTAQVGDWIIGLAPLAFENRIIYAMEINEILTFEKYYNDKRFKKKVPDYSTDKFIDKAGDNIYKPLKNGDFKQLQSRHSNGVNENPESKEHDLNGKHVLISSNFYYFGSEAIDLPDELHQLKVTRGHKNKFSQTVIDEFLKYISEQPKGVNGAPFKWASKDTSWKSCR